MPEVLPRNNLGESVLPHKLEFPSLSFDQLIDRVGEVAPAVVTNRARLARSARTLLHKYGVGRDFFKADDNAIGLLLAAGLHDESTHNSHRTPDKRENDRTVSDCFARTLFGPYSQTHPQEKQKNTQITDDERLAHHRKYENADLSRRLKDWIETSEEMRPTIKELMIDGQPIAFNVIVLGIGSHHHLSSIDLTRAGMKDYAKTLEGRAKEFLDAKESYHTGQLPLGYTCTLNGQRYICVMETTARILLEPDAVGCINNDAYQFEIATVKHEFVHTQGHLALKDTTQEDAYLGKIFEEFRAELFSHYCSPGYRDIHDAVSTTMEFSSLLIGQLMYTVPLGGASDKIKFYSTLIRELGIANAAKLTGLLPKACIDDHETPQSSKELFAALDNGNLRKHYAADHTTNDIQGRLARLKFTRNISTKGIFNALDWLEDTICATNVKGTGDTARDRYLRRIGLVVTELNSLQEKVQGNQQELGELAGAIAAPLPKLKSILTRLNLSDEFAKVQEQLRAASERTLETRHQIAHVTGMTAKPTQLAAWHTEQSANNTTEAQKAMAASAEKTEQAVGHILSALAELVMASAEVYILASPEEGNLHDSAVYLQEAIVGLRDKYSAQI